MSITLESNSDIYQSELILNPDGTFNFTFTNTLKNLKGSGKWESHAEGYLINFLLLECINISNGKKFPENSIPYSNRLFKINQDCSYTLQGYFNPEDIILTLNEKI